MFETSLDDWDYGRALAELWRRSKYERGFISDPFGGPQRAEQGLHRMRALLAGLGDPHLRVPTVHIAGSKGKGSTGAFIATVASQAGHRVGFYTSPHLHRFPERIAINGLPLTDDAFASEARLVGLVADRLDASSSDEAQVTTFEFITAMACAAFARDACDLAVIEVGLGGRYDSTNVVAPIVSVITRIDLEHTGVLGFTYGEIAAQKAGILRAGVSCVSSPQVSEADEVITETAIEIGSPLQMGGRDWNWTGSWRSFTAAGPWGDWRDLALGLPGPHQVENACTALAALHFVNASGLTIPEPAARSGLSGTLWPGRFEQTMVDDRVLILDAAHTPAAAAALVSTWRELGISSPATVILGMSADKDPKAFLEALRPLIGHLIATRADSPRAAETEAIFAIASEMGIPSDMQPSVAGAVRTALKSGDAPILVTGSLFVVGEGREAIGLADPDPLWRALNDVNRARPQRFDRP